MDFSPEQLNRVKEIVKTTFGKDINEQEALECCQSMYLYGRAIARFQLLKAGKIQPNQTLVDGMGGR